MARRRTRPRATTLREYLATDGRAIHWDLIPRRQRQRGDTAIHPLQDVMGLDSSGRMNFPARAKAGGLALPPGAAAADAAARLRRMGALYERLPKPAL